jgi:ankyrin repeat protein
MKLIEAVNTGQEQNVRQILTTAKGEIDQQEFQQAFFDSYRLGKIGIAKLLIPYVDVNFKMGTIGSAALHVAAQNRQPEMTRFLLEHGADINVRNNQGYTPLHIAIDSELMAAVDLSDSLVHRPD